MQILAHPGIARVFDLDCDGDIWFLTMELVVGRTVSEWMRTPVALADAMHVIGACCAALDYAHSMGIVHGDLKPSNVLLTANGSIRLIDFGSVPTRSPGAVDEDKQNLSATPSFASPQVLAGMRAEARDDIFSLACLSYGILSEGARPFGDISSLEAHRARLCPAAIPGMPVEVFAVLARSLAGDRELRPASAREFNQELLGSAAEPDHAFGASRNVRNRKLRRVSVASIVVGVICAAGLMLPAARKIVAGTHEAIPVAEQLPVSPVDAQPSDLPQQASPAEPATDATSAETSAPAVHPPGIVSFETATIIAGSAQSLVAIPLKRLQSTQGSASVEWEIESGSAMPNVDYQPVKPQLVKFNDGEAVRSLFIPLIRTVDSQSQPPRTFTVLLRRVGGGVKLGPVARINVTIVPQPMYPDISSAVAISRFPGN
jgi:serine/threonine protein kinase